MAFGDNPGPPASHTQMRELTSLIESAGHSDFRDARGPLGLNQRQAGGKFTRDDADTFIAQLETELEGDDAPPPPEQSGGNYYDRVDPLRIEIPMDKAAKPGKHEIEAKLKYFYCVKKSGFCAPKRTTVKIPVKVR
jgi:hypothetical protein